MVVIVARWTVQAESLTSTLTFLNDLQKASRAEPGCLTYDYYQDPHHPQNILIYEEYKNAEAVEAHRMTRHFQELVIQKIVPHLQERSVKVFEHSP
ncbi:putative quinol monooxygenase [Bdellovibrio svalbardensis]|uniref:Antibiotic biosynthesis monooxygenase n=1 Tax=Bdellovibrio svalbardensis TaxID=2972972 RepID=A0ABT6DQ87_9BACT|nr:putative quinol monooxygenase [Bdellovibrio svalbardensis]MDG0818074.1 antibiotic biosynthesis monooxygenase [Bdellovibrio svalbardensis]